jgi:pimeloyl-ACP methyl ester carboxylesterase
LLCTRASPFPPFHDVADQLRAGTADRTASLAWWFAADALERPDPLVGVVRAMLENSDAQAWAAALDSIAVFDVLDELRGLPMAVDVVAAEHDGVAVPGHMADMAAATPRGQLHTIPGARHLVPLQRPDLVAPIIT